MRRPSVRVAVLSPSILLLAAALHAQGKPAVVTLSKPAAELADPFDMVAGVRELRDGRVVVADVFAKTVSVADFASGTVTQVGREGQGPNEYQFPRGVIALPGDTTLVPDPIQRRFFRVGPDGKAAGNIPFPEKLGGMVSFRGADQQGRLYLQGSPFAFGGGTMQVNPQAQVPDTVPVLRWNRATNALDTIARIKGPNLGIKVSGGQAARSIMIRQEPFAPQDDWAVTGQGVVGIARVGDYHVDWVPASGKAVAGPAVRYQPVKVGAADKEEILKRMRNPRGRMTITRGGPAPGSAPPPQEPEVNFPESKPPFVENATLAAPNGQLWVRRSMPAGSAPTYDVFDASGALVKQVVLPAESRVVGFGAKSVYVARSDADDLQYLGRYPLP